MTPRITMDKVFNLAPPRLLFLQGIVERKGIWDAKGSFYRKEDRRKSMFRLILASPLRRSVLAVKNKTAPSIDLKTDNI
jgi:hypothetical protein